MLREMTEVNLRHYKCFRLQRSVAVGLQVAIAEIVEGDAVKLPFHAHLMNGRPRAQWVVRVRDVEGRGRLLRAGGQMPIGVRTQRRSELAIRALHLR